MKKLILAVITVGIFAFSAASFTFAADSQEFLNETEKELQDNWGKDVLQDPLKEESDKKPETFDAVAEAEANQN